MATGFGAVNRDSYASTSGAAYFAELSERCTDDPGVPWECAFPTSSQSVAQASASSSSAEPARDAGRRLGEDRSAMKSAKKSAAKKLRADHGAAWSDESEASVMFFKQGEANAEADIAAYERELAETARPGALRRWWLLAGVAALAAGAVIAYVASS